MKVLAVDLGGTHATCALVENRTCVDSMVIDYRAAVASRDLAGVAMTFCGLVDSSTGRVLSTNPRRTTVWRSMRIVM